jgi:hypothetical protein
LNVQPDSFEVLRSNSISLETIITAPLLNTESIYGRNYLHLSHQLIQHFQSFGKVYTSPLTVLPIRSGRYFFPSPLKQPKHQKLTRYIKGVQIGAIVKNLLADYVHSTDDHDLGLRAKTKSIEFGLGLQQQNFIPGQRGAGWDVIGADFDMVDLEVRTFKSLYYAESDAKTPLSEYLSPGLRISTEIAQPDEARLDWKMLCNPDDASIDTSEELCDFLWAPKMVYFRHGSEDASGILNAETGESKIKQRGTANEKSKALI